MPTEILSFAKAQAITTSVFDERQPYLPQLSGVSIEIHDPKPGGGDEGGGTENGSGSQGGDCACGWVN